MDDLAAALRKAAVDSKWLATFEDEELDLRLLRDMKNLTDNLQELGLSAGESRRLAEVIKAPPAAAQASAPAVDLVPDISCSPCAVSISARVLAIQQECFAEDVPPPPDADNLSDDALYTYFESGGDASSLLVSPSWQIAPQQQSKQPQPSFSCKGCCSSAASSSSSASSSQASPPNRPSPPDLVGRPHVINGPILGAIPLKWQGYEADFEYGAESTIRDLKEYIRRKTDVPLARQKIFGWSPKDKKRAEEPEALLSELGLARASTRLTVLGTPEVEAAQAEADLERGKRTARFIASDLNVKPGPTLMATVHKSQQTPNRSHRRHDGKPIHANHGGGIFLDPTVWAVTEEEEEERRRQRGTHVLNPATNRLERLEITNALLGEGAGGHTPLDPNAPQQPQENQPINVDLLGTARGRCNGCERCEGYVRREVLPENANDVTVLTCARCGCGCERHEAI